jgi:PKD domain
MKKLSFLAVIVAMVILSSCNKDASQNLALGNNSVTPPANVTSTIKVVAAPSGDLMNEPFNGNFIISVPDLNNVFENQSVKLVSKSMDVVQYTWKINNDLKITEKKPTLSFPWHGNYHITLTVTDRNGITATSAQDLIILCNFMH